MRVLLYGVALGELWDIAAHRPYTLESGYGPTLLLGITIGATCFTLAGAWTRWSAIVTWVALHHLQPFLLEWYEVDWTLELCTLVFCFAPEPRALAVDAVLRRIDPAEADRPVPWPFVLLVTLVMTGMYLDSVWTKLTSSMWTNGTALWTANFVPYVAGMKLPLFLQSKWMSIVGSYVTIGYEGLFPLVLLRPLRKPWVLTGLLLHLGIAIFLPLTYFGLIMIAILALYLGAFQDPVPGPWPPLARALDRRAYGVVCALFALLVIRCYVHMKQGGNRRDAVTRMVGVHPTGVYANSKFTIRAPIVRLVLRTPDGPVDLPGFDAEGYPTVRNRFWKQFGFFTRIWGCGMDRVYRHIAMWSDRCETEECTVEVYERYVAFDKFAYDPELVARFRAAGWTLAGEVSFRRADKVSVTDMHWKSAQPGRPNDGMPLAYCKLRDNDGRRSH
jgi:hypothetical protein